jgi:hypothetical protein
MAVTWVTYSPDFAQWLELAVIMAMIWWAVLAYKIKLEDRALDVRRKA